MNVYVHIHSNMKRNIHIDININIYINLHINIIITTYKYKYRYRVSCVSQLNLVAGSRWLWGCHNAGWIDANLCKSSHRSFSKVHVVKFIAVTGRVASVDKA